MKTYTIIKGFFAVGVLSVVLSGCSEDAMDRINKDHGHTQSVAGRFILTDVITSTAFSNAGGDLNTYLSSYIEYEVGVDNQLYMQKPEKVNRHHLPLSIIHGTTCTQH